MSEQTKTAENGALQKRYVGIKETLIYGIANGGQCIGYNMVRGQLQVYLMTVCKIDWKVIFTMTLVMGIWDAFNDPLMGTVVDRTRTRYGKLRPYLMGVPIPLGIATALFFGGAELFKFLPQLADTKMWYLFITYFVWEFFYTIGDIPFWGLSAAVSPNPLDRSRVIKSARLVSGIVGGLPGMIFPIFIDLSNKGVIPFSLSQLFLVLGIIAGSIGMFLFSLSGFCVKERVVQNSQEPSIIDCFKYMFKNKHLMLIVLASIIGTVEGIAGSYSQYFYPVSLGMASLSLVAGIPGTVTNWLTFGFMSKLEKKYSSKKIIIGNAFMKAGIAVIIFLLGSRHYTNAKVIVPLMAIYGVFTSIGYAISAVIPTKMIGETVDYMEWKTGERSEGMAFSLLTFISKLTGSLSTSVSVAIAPLIGLENVNDQLQLVENSGINTRFWLWGCVTAIPAVLGLLALIPYKFYDLEGKKLEMVQSEIRARREELAKRSA